MKGKQYLSFLADNIPTVLPILITALTFCLGWIYLYFYFGFFGLDVSALHLPILYYFQNVLIPVFIILTFLLAYGTQFITQKIFHRENNFIVTDKSVFYRAFSCLQKMRTVIEIIIAIVILICGLSIFINFMGRALALLVNGSADFIQLLFMVYSHVTVFYLLCFPASLFFHFRIQKNRYYMLLQFYRVEIIERNLLVFILLILSYAGYQFITRTAEFNASNVIRQETINNPIVTIIHKDVKLANDLKNRELVFILYTNESYYLVEKDRDFDSKKDTPNVYIIPKEEIALINLRKAKT